jgi:hypothetical protein
MSSSMLEQAIIDAEALKEAAVKTAEQTILEKYSADIKNAVSSLLEQDEEDPFAEEDPMASGEVEEREDVVDQLDMAATAGEKVCPCPEDGQEIVLDLDQLVAAAEEEEAPEEEGEVADTEEELFEIDDNYLLAEADKEDLSSDQKNEMDADDDGDIDKKDLAALRKAKKKEDEPKTEAVEKIAAQIFEDSEAEETYHYGDDEGKDDAELNNLKKDYQTDDVRQHEKALGYDMDYDEDRERRREKGTHFRESFDLTSDELENIIEELVVDIENVATGDNFMKHPTEAQYERGLNVALAREQDTAFAEEQEELRKAIKKLQEQVKSQTLQLNKQKKDYDNLKSIALKAGKKLEEVNFSNAKLIYTNRILEGDSLNERQKDKLVEAISKVGSVEEAKIVFDTLKENLSPRRSNGPKTLNEAVSRNNQLILKSNNEKQPASQSQVDRLKKLAGII